MSGNVICVCVQGNRVEMAMWLPKKTHLLGWAESLKRSSIELPDDFEERMTALRVKWDQLEVRPSTIKPVLGSLPRTVALDRYSHSEMIKKS